MRPFKRLSLISVVLLIALSGITNEIMIDRWRPAQSWSRVKKILMKCLNAKYKFTIDIDIAYHT